jgi:hypothetical protein
MNRGMYQLSTYLARLEVEIEYGKSPKPSQMVENLKSRYRTFVDKHNLAIIKMLEADYILSPPFSNPIALNLLLIERSEPGFSIAPWDCVEGGLKLGDTEAASELYRQAYDLFTDRVSPRGRAAVLLRQGCVEHHRASAGDVSPEEKSQRCETARQRFTEALQLFQLDEAHSQIVRGHQIPAQQCCPRIPVFEYYSRILFAEYSNRPIFLGIRILRIFPEYYSNTTCNVTCSCQGAIIRVFRPFFWSTTTILSSILSSISSISSIDSSIASILSSNLLVSSILLSK